jgi:ABC-type branched-subunit amino acid transport system ATPase component
VARVLDRFGLGALGAVRADQISYAHRKLVALARLFASRSRLLLLDEPASGLDESEQVMIAEAIRGLATDGLTVCIVEHNMDLVRALADRVYFLAQGKVLADGTPDEVFEASHLAEIYFGTG